MAQQIFVLLHVAMAALLRCSLDYVFTLHYKVFRWLVYSLYTFMNTKKPSALSSSFRVVVVFTSCLRMDSFTYSIQFSSALSHKEFHRISQHSLRKFPILVLLHLLLKSLVSTYSTIPAYLI